MLEVKVVENLGYCPGVSKAIADALEFRKKQGRTVYSLGELAHNRQTVQTLTDQGIICLVHALAPDDPVVITAHGAPPQLYSQLIYSQLPVRDCTCPIVKKAQQAAAALAHEGFDIIIYGDPAHQEVKGLVGWARDRFRFAGRFDNLFEANQTLKPLELGRRLGVVAQTTSIPGAYAEFVHTLIHHYFAIGTSQEPGTASEFRVLDTICPIVAKRLAATQKLATEVDMMLVVGSPTSANSQNLVTVARQATAFQTISNPVFRVGGPEQVDGLLASVTSMSWGRRIGISAGTSTPIEVVDDVVETVRRYEG